MPRKKKRGSTISRKPGGKNKKESKTAYLHHKSGDYIPPVVPLLNSVNVVTSDLSLTDTDSTPSQPLQRNFNLKRSNQRLKAQMKVLEHVTSEALRTATSAKASLRKLEVKESSIQLMAQASVDKIKIKAKEHAQDIGKRAARAVSKKQVTHATKVKKLKSIADTQKQSHQIAIENLKTQHENKKKFLQEAHDNEMERIRIDGETAREKAHESWENHKKMLHASTVKSVKKQKLEAAKILKSTKCSSTKELKACQSAADALLHAEKTRSEECLNTMHAQIGEQDAFISSLVGDLVSANNDKCQVVRKYEDRVLNVKGEVKGLIHEERKVLSDKQNKEKQKQKRKEEKHKEELCDLRCKSEFR